MFRRRKDTVLYRGRVVDLSIGPRRGSIRRFSRLPRFPRFEWSGENRRNAAIWAAIWGFLLLPACIDFINGYATDTDGCRIVGVVDGDTVALYCPGDFDIVNGRILGYDTPEIFSPRCLSETIRGMAAMWHLRLALWRADRIAASRHGQDRYGRELVGIAVDGQNLAWRMIADGVARPYSGGRRQGWCD